MVEQSWLHVAAARLPHATIEARLEVGLQPEFAQVVGSTACLATTVQHWTTAALDVTEIPAAAFCTAR